MHRPPNASNLNFTPGVLVPNAVISKLGELGRICLYTSAQTDLIVDATGYYSDSTPTTTSAHLSVTPQRLFDTRPGRAAVFNLGHPIAGTHRQVVTVSPAGVVPAGIAGISLNVGITAPAAPGFLSVTPGNCPAPGSPAPNTSNLNFSAGQTVANQVQVQVPFGGGAGSGKVCVYASATTDVFIDAFGIFLQPGTAGDGLRAQTPLRLLDTRPGRSAASPDKTPIATNGTKALNVAAYGHLPAGTHAVVLNVTAVNEAAPGYLSVFPCTGGNHTVSNINFTRNVIRPNLVDVSITGGVCLFASAKTDVIVDLAGWYQP